MNTKCYQIKGYDLYENIATGDLRLMVKGDDLYLPVIKHSFSGLRFMSKFSDNTGKYDWGVYIKNWTEQSYQDLEKFCEVLKTHIYLEHPQDKWLTQCFALSYHTFPDNTRTQLGQVMRNAKPYDNFSNSGSTKQANVLADELGNFIEKHPVYQKTDLLVAMPPSNPNKPFDLPTYITGVLSKRLGITNATANITKLRTTIPMKNCKTWQQKTNNIANAFSANKAIFADRTIVLIDDIYASGSSINEAAKELKTVGAKNVYGLTVTKTKTF